MREEAYPEHASSETTIRWRRYDLGRRGHTQKVEEGMVAHLFKKGDKPERGNRWGMTP